MRDLLISNNIESFIPLYEILSSEHQKLTIKAPVSELSLCENTYGDR